jgi:hypothetical protein
MTRFYIVELESTNIEEFDLDSWARHVNWNTMTLENDGVCWQLRNERGMELGTAFQRGG